MKNSINLSNKKTKSKPNNIDLLRLDKIICFVVRIAKFLIGSTLIINIDQLQINRHIKLKRNWDLKCTYLKEKFIILRFSD